MRFMMVLNLLGIFLCIWYVAKMLMQKKVVTAGIFIFFLLWGLTLFIVGYFQYYTLTCFEGVVKDNKVR